ncbi:Amino acid permease family [Synechococcus sp. PCC 7335]|uniref:amino acid permease n=1 Tax=Synechococcus sp. (strain ATCC 29403 / PCC 7335) TaxID=91464 RepID=UPI00017EDD32|nr:amino acid permease [Synechococcus sp. PCC 7335]EDX85062.1 Amino acid permease family [Synechococcus sp. PCC 7335]
MTLQSPHPSTLDTQDEAIGLGTFGGVFTPSILTILGVIMYLRFGWVVGQVGLYPTMAIVTIATSITFLTALSISAIATDQVVRAGGAYYMISRSLGIETGGAVGIPLYFAQALSVALYTIGFAESVKNVFPNVSIVVVALITTVLVTALALASADIAIKAQYVIMAAIALSLVALFFGHDVTVDPSDAVEAAKIERVGFWAVFAVFFPAVTGIMSGVNMSGDLKDPIRSIPRGTLAAVIVGYIIYMAIPFVLVSRTPTASNALLNPEMMVMKRIAIGGHLLIDSIVLGVWGATLSSAIGSILGAPRILQALARDNILPRSLRWLGKGNGPTDDPRLGTLFTLGIVLAVVMMGSLDAIAPVLSMFFLTTYMVLNIAAGLEGFLQSPSFRPTFKVHWSLSVLGAIGCIAVMFLINPVATIAALVIVGLIYFWLERRQIESTWGDVRQGIWMTVVRTALLNIDDNADPKNWRPHLLVLSGAPSKRWYLIEMARALTHNRGLITVASIIPSGSRSIAQQEKAEVVLREFLDKRGVQAFAKIVTADDPFIGTKQLLETYGMGPLIPNTVLLGDSDDPDIESIERYCNTIRVCHGAKRNVVIYRDESGADAPDSLHPPMYADQADQRIDVWWGGLQSNGGLMLILAYLLRTSWQWRSAEIRLKLVVSDEEALEAAEVNLENLTNSLRIGAKPEVILANNRPFEEILRTSSASADLVFLGLAVPHEGGYQAYYQTLQDRVVGLPATVMVLASENLDFSELLQKDVS